MLMTAHSEIQRLQKENKKLNNHLEYHISDGLKSMKITHQYKLLIFDINKIIKTYTDNLQSYGEERK